MKLFGTRNSDTTHRAAPRRHGPFHGKDKNRGVADGPMGSLVNPHATRGGRKQDKREQRSMGGERDTHISLMAKIKGALGIQSTPRRTRSTERTQY